MVATRNDGHQKSRKRRCFPIFGVSRDQLNGWRALTLVAIASRKNGERARRQPAARFLVCVGGYSPKESIVRRISTHATCTAAPS